MTMYPVSTSGVGYLWLRGGTHKGHGSTKGARAPARVAARGLHQVGSRAESEEVVV